MKSIEKCEFRFRLIKCHSDVLTFQKSAGEKVYFGNGSRSTVFDPATSPSLNKHTFGYRHTHTLYFSLCT